MPVDATPGAVQRLTYLSDGYIPSRRAGAVQAVRMCDAIAALGPAVELVHKWSANRCEPGVEDIAAYYGVENDLSFRGLPRPAIPGGGILFALAMSRTLAKRPRPDLVLARDPIGAWLAARRGLPLVYESHVPPRSPWLRKLLRRTLAAPTTRGLVTISQALLNRLEELSLVPEGTPRRVLPDAAREMPGGEVATAAPHPSLADHRGRRVGYVGQLHAGKGIEILVALAARMPDLQFHVVGGSEAELERWRRRTSDLANCHFHGFVRPADLFHWYPHFDVLVMPYGTDVRGASGRSDLSAWMSPMKLFEFMAAGRPIVSSDLPVLREILVHERNALLAPPGDLEAWSAALVRLVEDPSLGERLAWTALEDFRGRFTWEHRARRMLEVAQG